MSDKTMWTYFFFFVCTRNHRSVRSSWTTYKNVINQRNVKRGIDYLHGMNNIIANHNRKFNNSIKLYCNATTGITPLMINSIMFTFYPYVIIYRLSIPLYHTPFTVLSYKVNQREQDGKIRVIYADLLKYENERWQVATQPSQNRLFFFFFLQKTSWFRGV